ncbi:MULTISPECIES: pyridoxamine 5'-phosphate oxidase [Kocuria]|uniref:Pyridoxamine 5'-phosphate oxidase n=1 Tax=Kocuria subflava TaxID=1736139 RepID=A0A846TW29_9MICC|nr:pyridoxamine 5'-phosphate oxidase [Kocuria sp. CPCC 104605]NKE09437.1 pyridoxamine 5'-phosphate oxidase [Kocuria subflava]
MHSNDYQRIVYTGTGLEAAGGTEPGPTPLTLLEQWWEAAVADPRVTEPAAATLATFDVGTGLPDSRVLLIKDFDAQGLRFFTNRASAKGQQLETTPAASITMLWHPMFRQVRFRGPVEQTSRDEDLAYWQTRPRESQIGSSSSHQSQPVESREQVAQNFQKVERAHPDGEVPLPTTWGGYRLRPVEVEFWVGMPARLHDRVQWSADRPLPMDSNHGWSVQRLQP